jgi:uncharacterized protein YkwD
MKKRMRFAFAAVFMCLLFSCSKETVNQEDIPVAVNMVAVENELLQLVNQHRNTLGYPGLSFSAVAYDYANSHTDYMISTGTLSHHNFSARASQITSEVNAKAVAENVAKDYSSAEKALEGWLGSEAHRKTMEGDFSHTAVSVKQDANGNLYFTQLFYLQ